MKVFARQQLGLPFFQPLGSSQRLALWAVAIATGVVCVSFVAALVTPFEMASQDGGPAAFDGAEHALLSWRQRSGMRLAKLFAVGAHNISDFKGRPHWQRALRFLISDRKREQIQGAGCGADRGSSQPKITGGGRQTAVAQQKLNFAYVGPSFQ
jgi:hypothetical protein